VVRRSNTLQILKVLMDGEDGGGWG
jgi:hypothetical protein